MKSFIFYLIPLSASAYLFFDDKIISSIICLAITLLVIGAHLQIKVQADKTNLIKAILGCKSPKITFTKNNGFIAYDPQSSNFLFEPTIGFVERMNKVAALAEQAGIDGKITPPRNLIYSSDKILGIETFVDGNQFSRTVRSSQAIGGIVGGALFGGLGAVVGALSGKQEFNDNVSSVKLRFLVDDPVEFFYDFELLPAACKKSSFIFKTALNESRHWESTIKVLDAKKNLSPNQVESQV